MSFVFQTITYHMKIFEDVEARIGNVNRCPSLTSLFPNTIHPLQHLGHVHPDNHGHGKLHTTYRCHVASFDLYLSGRYNAIP